MLAPGGKEKLSKKGKFIRQEAQTKSTVHAAVIMMSANAPVNLNKVILEVRSPDASAGLGMEVKPKK